MKRFLLLLVLALPIICYADNLELVIPEWSDFAPKSFVDVKEQKGIMSKINVDANYWYERKAKFNKDIQACQELQSQNEMYSCYEKVKLEQYQENSDYNARIEAKMNSVNNSIQPMMDRTDSLIPINGYFDSLMKFQPNELKY